MRYDFIKIRGARMHNLKNINLDIPKNKLVVLTGVSGSGKSSLAFDTLYAEGQRRYVESLSAYARQFLGVLQKPEVDKIEGISPAIAIEQRKAGRNPRSTVGTMTEIYDYLRVLFARIGQPHCPKCKKQVSRQTIDQIAKQVLGLPRDSEVLILGPVVRAKKGEHRAILEEINKQGFVRVRIDGVVQRIEEALEGALDRNKKHNIEVVVDRLVINRELERARLVDSLETALKLGKGIVIIKPKSKILNPEQSQSSKPKIQNDLIFSEHFACEDCGISLPEIEPRLFSFNSPFGACPSCQGLGKKLEVDPKLVIANPNLSLAQGAVLPWARASHRVGRQSWFWRLLSELAQKHNFSLHRPVKELAAENLNFILYGDRGQFEGVIPNLERRFFETDSEAVREEIKKYMRERECERCSGRRLREEALAVTAAGKSISRVAEMEMAQAKKFFEKLNKKTLGETKFKIAHGLLKEIIQRLRFISDVGLDYLTLSRETAALSGGEEQRTRLATQLGSKLSGVLYILDEPSVGLHARDQKRLISALKKLRDSGNTVVLTEHDEQTIRQADWLVDLGPGAGKHGGRVVFEGTPRQLLKEHTLTADYLSGRKRVEIEKNSKLKSQNGKPQLKTKNFLIIKGAAEHNLKNIDVKIPLGKFVCLTGVSGSGKSSLLNDIIARALYQRFYDSKEEPGRHRGISGIEFLDKVVFVDQSPIGRTPRSNPATYTGSFTYIREIFAKTKEAKIRGYRPGRFSFNLKAGRCQACEGQGLKKIEMYFLPDVYVSCLECRGKRYNQETLEIEYKSKNIADVLQFTIKEALKFFEFQPLLMERLKTLDDVGLGYICLGQPAPSLSGGEAQRVKLSAELAKRATGSTFYILDEPTTGLHPDDVNKLLIILRRLVEKGNTVLSSEHNLAFIRNADWVIDLGPEAGDRGGYIMAEGPPYEIAKNKKSWTGRFLSSLKQEC